MRPQAPSPPPAVADETSTKQGARRGGGGGIIFNISSLAGLCAFPGHAYYHAGKFAVEGWTESVAREMHPDCPGGVSLLPSIPTYVP